MSGPRVDACSAIVEDEDGQPEMWVMGGRDFVNDLATVEAYNPRTNTWRSCLPLGQPRTEAVAGVVGGRLVVAGGFDGGDDHLTSVEAYTPTAMDPAPPLPHATNEATACVLNGRLYVMGGMGCNKLQVLEMSEENGFSWTVKADLPAERHGAACAVVDGNLWLMGGRTNPTPLSSVIIYDVATDTWAAGPELPRRNCSCRAAVHDGELHLTDHDGVYSRDARGVGGSCGWNAGGAARLRVNRR